MVAQDRSMRRSGRRADKPSMTAKPAVPLMDSAGDHPVHAGRRSGLLLVLAAIAGLCLANVLPAGRVTDFWDQPWRLASSWQLPSLANMFDEGLMVLFFLAAGLEIKLELCCGSLRGFRRAALPVAAACGGVLVPALIYLVCNAGLPQVSGWAVPTATDIAFATGMLGLLPQSLGRSLRPLLLALAMIDDVIAVLVVMLFYSQALAPGGAIWLLAAATLYLLLRCRDQAATVMLLSVGVLIWIGLWRCGLHPALAGMVLGLLWPAGRTRPWHGARRLKAALDPWVAYVVMPGFALIHASIDLHGLVLTSTVALRLGVGVVAGLVLGKPIGIVLAAWVAIRLGLARRPAGMSWPQLALIGMLAGIGLTMAMFITTLALTDVHAQRLARCAVLLGSLLSTLLALGFGGWLSRRGPPIEPV